MKESFLCFLVAGARDQTSKKKIMVKKGLGKGSSGWKGRENPKNLKKQASEYEKSLEELNLRVPEGMAFLFC